MANQGAKRQVENNRKKLQLLQQVIFAVTVRAISVLLAELAEAAALADCLSYRVTHKGVYVTPSGYICARAPRLLLQVICYSALRAANPCQYSPLCLLQLHQGAGRQVLTCDCFAHRQHQMPANLQQG